MFERILIANRGEIACRVIRTANRLGVEAVAVYSDADRDALHVTLADRCVHIGPAPATDSYLRADKIVAAALRAGAQAIHPGYGFLSENPEFADACAAAGLTFIGPPASAIRAMGAKHQALVLMARHGVPTLPGYRGTEQSDETLIEAAKSVGFPLIIKPSAGGGGKGMSIVRDERKLASAIASARRTARSAFGDETLMLERYLERPRHVEVQVFADQHGNTVHLSERDCSSQRRHQKVVEEAPAPFISDSIRTGLHRAAINAAQAVDYVGAGTVEFLLDDKPDGGFYFMEMNTRLQVEHPVTEQIMGLDLIEWQLRIASGERLPSSQDELQPRGHAIEVRLYAEDPAKRFMPQTGRIEWLEYAPHSTRVDTGVSQGSEISPFYDPMISKIIEYGEDRAAALKRLKRTLDHTHVGPLTTNIGMLRALCRHQRWCDRPVDTEFLERCISELSAPPMERTTALLAAAFWVFDTGGPDQADASPWVRLHGFRLNRSPVEHIEMEFAGQTHIAIIEGTTDNRTITLDGVTMTADGLRSADHGLLLNRDGLTHLVKVRRAGNRLFLLADGEEAIVTILERARRSTAGAAHEDRLIAPMPGKIVSVLVTAGEAVRKGQALLVLEAMKMEHTISAPQNGTVASVRFNAGDQVSDGDLLIELGD